MIPGTEKVESADDQIRADFAAYQEFEGSEELKHYLDLEKEVTSSEFALRKKKILKAKYKTSEAARKEARYNALQKRAKGEPSEELKNLETYVQSEEFEKEKRFLTMKPKERYETTDEYQKEDEYQTLKKSEKVVWYFKTKKKYPFKELEKWEQTFGDEFDSSALDTGKWMTRYFWGDKGMNASFVLEDDRSFLTDGANIEFYDNKVRLVTKAEKTEGLMWRSHQGFVLEQFDYTSGMMSTARSFRQKYGIFKAKVKMSGNGVAQSFWMVSDSTWYLYRRGPPRVEEGKLYANYF
ncbi:MAG: hypothetical protein R2751_11105 [Bacteroidales bacterium]